ncbi:MAG: type I methionyl aminopeptidase [Pelolinea sp.]|nr:type I methionyl aminopeptidase [Pelolinea sp.]
MISIRNKDEIQGLRTSGRIVAETFAVIENMIRPGVVLRDIDQVAEKYILGQDAETLYKGIRQRPHQNPFPGVITTSLNHQICHGIPDGRILQDGDIIGIDIGLRYKGWCGDACKTYIVGKVQPGIKKLVETAKQSLYKGIRAAQVGQPIGVIGAAIQEFAESKGFSVVREYGGHGIGRELWEEPFIPHIGPKSRGPKLRAGMVINIEPMINIGKPDTHLMPDEWTVETADKSFSAQFEHTIVITENGPDILSIIPT